jgi:hypothetical protein
MYKLDFQTIQNLNTKINSSVFVEDLFGKDHTLGSLHSEYKKLSLVCHPNIEPSAEETLLALATQTYVILQTKYQQAQEKIKNRTYGKYTLVESESYQSKKIIVGKQTFTISYSLGKGSISNVFKLEDNDPINFSFIKIPVKASDNDLIDSEYNNLKQITAVDPDRNKEQFFAVQRKYVPFNVKLFSIKESNILRKAAIYSIPNTPHFSVENFMKIEKFSTGLPYQHVYWIIRRLLLTAFMAHERGIVHGAITPNHILLAPEQHGLCLIGWTHSAKLGVTNIPLVDVKYSNFLLYDTIKDKRKSGIDQDKYSIFELFRYLLNGNTSSIPDKVFSYLIRSLRTHPNSNQTCLDIHEELGSIIEACHGKREFVELKV